MLKFAKKTIEQKHSKTNQIIRFLIYLTINSFLKFQAWRIHL